MSLSQLDPILTKPKRLAALGVLGKSPRTEFAFLREVLELSDSDLSKQMSALTEAGYARAKKTGMGGGRQTWFEITPTGSFALRQHMEALNALVVDAPIPPPAPKHAS